MLGAGAKRLHAVLAEVACQMARGSRPHKIDDHKKFMPPTYFIRLINITSVIARLHAVSERGLLKLGSGCSLFSLYYWY